MKTEQVTFDMSLQDFLYIFLRTQLVLNHLVKEHAD